MQASVEPTTETTVSGYFSYALSCIRVDIEPCLSRIIKFYPVNWQRPIMHSRTNVVVIVFLLDNNFRREFRIEAGCSLLNLIDRKARRLYNFALF